MRSFEMSFHFGGQSIIHGQSIISRSGYEGGNTGTAMGEEDHSLEGEDRSLFDEYLTGTGYFGQLDLLSIDIIYLKLIIIKS